MRCRSKNAGAGADRVAPRPHQRFDACWSVQQLSNRRSTRLAQTRRKASWYLTTLRLESNNAAGHGARQSRTKASASNGVSVTGVVVVRALVAVDRVEVRAEVAARERGLEPEALDDRALAARRRRERHG